MNKLTIFLIIAAIGVVGALGYFFGYDHGWEQSVKNEDPQYPSMTSVQYSGTITRNSAHVSEPWYLEYYDGQKDARTRLGFEGSALCSRSGETTNCGDFEFRPNETVKVTGSMKSDYLAVNNLEVLNAALPPKAAETTFQETKEYGFYGTITLSGYIDVQKRICNPGDMCGETVEYASFVFTTDNEAIKKFTGSMQGNSFVAGDRVGIGCLVRPENMIVYENDADIGWKNGDIRGADFTKLMASSKSNPVQLKMTREVYTSGRGAPDCYSHFRNFDVL